MKRYSPLSSVVVDCVPPMSVGAAIVTVARGRTAAVASRTVPGWRN